MDYVLNVSVTLNVSLGAVFDAAAAAAAADGAGCCCCCSHSSSMLPVPRLAEAPLTYPCPSHIPLPLSHTPPPHYPPTHPPTQATNQKNAVLVGGVALNSVLNGRILKEVGFENVFIPPGPGDEGVAVGCAMYGLQRVREREAFEAFEASKGGEKGGEQSGDRSAAVSVPFMQTAFPAYQGKVFTPEDIEEALGEWAPWIQVQSHTQESLVNAAVERIAAGQVVGWFQGRSEFGQRALGARSILADPRNGSLRRVINECVKEREWYRPLAPSVLDEYAGGWFEGLTDGANQSPYMSLTATVKEDKVRSCICH